MTACFRNNVRVRTTRHFSYTLKLDGFLKKIPFRLAELWDMVLVFVYYMETNAYSKKQKRKAETLFSALNNSNTKARIFYLADLLEHVNQLNKTQQERNTNLVDCAEKVHSFLNKLSLRQMHLQKNEFGFFVTWLKLLKKFLDS